MQLEARSYAAVAWAAVWSTPQQTNITTADMLAPGFGTQCTDLG